MSEFLTVPQICARLPGAKGAKNVTTSTVTRWIAVGCPARNGERVKLAATRAGSRWLVKETDLELFFEALAGAAETPPVETRTDAKRRQEIERANRELEQAGC